MTGTGTQEDPYIVINVDEFIEAAPEDGNAYIKLGADINMDGVQNQIVSFAELDGDGHKIVNMVSQYTGSSQHSVLTLYSETGTITIKNTLFRAGCVRGAGTIIRSSLTNKSCYLTFENCDFSIKVEKSAGYRSNFVERVGSANYNLFVNVCKCVFDITYDSIYSCDDLFDNCIVRIEDSHVAVDIHLKSNVSSAKFINGTLINSYITGSFEVSETTGTGYQLFQGSFYHTYFAISSQNRGKANLVQGTFYDTCFYDNQIWSGSTDITNSRKLYALPTEKCKDMDYLNSIGFYVAPEE